MADKEKGRDLGLEIKIKKREGGRRVYKKRLMILETKKHSFLSPLFNAQFCSYRKRHILDSETKKISGKS